MLDFYNGFMLLGVIGMIGIIVGNKGIFGLIFVNWICVDIFMKLLVVCKCEKWEEMFLDNDKWFIWFVEFVFGNINNKI